MTEYGTEEFYNASNEEKLMESRAISLKFDAIP